VRKLFPLQVWPPSFRRGTGPPLRATTSPCEPRQPPYPAIWPYTTSVGRAARNIVNASAQELTIDPVCGPKPMCV
jgi:hypothetical protein